MIDPELAARVLPFAVAGPTLDTPAPLLLLRPPDLASAVAPEAPPPPHRRRARLSPVVGITAAVALLGVAFLPPRQAPRLTDVPPRANAAPPRSTPASSAPSHTAVPVWNEPAVLTWRRDRKADYYLVEVFAGERLAWAATVRTTTTSTPASLAPRRYSWRVFAGSGRATSRDVRGPLESGWFRVTPQDPRAGVPVP